jgi:hypothetical protein
MFYFSVNIFLSYKYSYLLKLYEEDLENHDNEK